jgi:hypothetical protein
LLAAKPLQHAGHIGSVPSQQVTVLGFLRAPHFLGVDAVNVHLGQRIEDRSEWFESSGCNKVEPVIGHRRHHVLFGRVDQVALADRIGVMLSAERPERHRARLMGDPEVASADGPDLKPELATEVRPGEVQSTPKLVG